MRALKSLLLLALFVTCAPIHAAEKIVSKANVELIFSMKKAEWEAYAPRIADPKWKIKLKRVDTGIGVMAFDPTTGMGMSIQPLYIDGNSPPEILVVGSFYPKNKLPPNLPDLRADIEKEAQRDLGYHYAVTARYVQLSPSLEGVEISVMRSNNAAK